jgi:tetratricopeptide (TPR) repeat protein
VSAKDFTSANQARNRNRWLSDTLPQPNQFFDRANEFEVLKRAALDAADESQRRVRGVLIVGPAGIGKTSFATVAANRLRDEFDGFIFLDAQQVTHGDSVVQSLSRRMMDAFAGPATHQEGDFHWIRHTLSTQRILVLIDNIDGFRNVDDLVALFEGAGSSFAILTARMHMRVPLPTIELGPLSPDDARALLSTLLEDTAVTASTRERLAQISGGSPIAVHLMAGVAARLLQEGSLDVDRLEQELDNGFPPSRTLLIRDLLHNLIRRLPANSSHLTRTVGALLSEQVSKELVAAVSHLDAQDVEEAFAQLVTYPIMRDANSGPGYYEMHDLLRAAILDDTPESLVKDVREREAAFYIEQCTRILSPKGSPPDSSWLRHNARNLEKQLEAAGARENDQRIDVLVDVLTTSYAQSGDWKRFVGIQEQALRRALRGGDRRKAFLHVELAADGAVQLGRHSEAIAGYEQAMNLLDDNLGLEGQRVRSRILLKLAAAHYRTGDPDEALSCGMTARSIANEIGDPHLLFQVESQNAQLLRATGMLEEAQWAYEAAFAVAPESAARELSADRASLYLAMGKLEEAYSSARNAEEIGRSAGDQHLSAFARGLEGIVLLRQGNFAEAALIFAAAIDLARATSDAELLGWLLLYLARAQAAAGGDETAITTYRSVSELGGQLSASVETAALAELTDLLFKRGAIRDAEDTCRRALRTARSSPQDESEILLRFRLATILVASGRVELAVSELEALASVGRQRDRADIESAALGLLSELYATLGLDSDRDAALGRLHLLQRAADVSVRDEEGDN